MHNSSNHEYRSYDCAVEMSLPEILWGLHHAPQIAVMSMMNG